MPPKKDLECYTKKRLPQNGGGTYTTCVEGQKKPKFKVVKKIEEKKKMPKFKVVKKINPNDDIFKRS